jgi:hypothetical protein
MNGDQPIVGLLVTLTSKGNHGTYACNGVTNDRGMAEIRSSRGSFTGRGVPAGTYTVFLSETIELPPELVPQESDQDLPMAARMEKDRRAEQFMQAAERSVPAVLTTAVASPLELVVGRGQNATLTVDVAAHR